jgi:hypothetical protein
MISFQKGDQHQSGPSLTHFWTSRRVISSIYDDGMELLPVKMSVDFYDGIITRQDVSGGYMGNQRKRKTKKKKKRIMV